MPARHISDQWLEIDGGSVGVAIGDHVGGNFLEVRPDGETVFHGTARFYWHEHGAATLLKKGATPPADGLVGIMPTLDFSHLRTESAYYEIDVPFGMQIASDVEANIDWCHTLGHQPDTRVRWEMEYAPVSAGGSVAATPIVIGRTSLPNMLGGFMCRCTLAPDLVGLTAHAAVGIRVYRKHDHADDQLAGDARMIHVHFHYLMQKLGEAT